MAMSSEARIAMATELIRQSILIYRGLGISREDAYAHAVTDAPNGTPETREKIGMIFDTLWELEDA